MRSVLSSTFSWRDKGRFIMIRFTRFVACILGVAGLAVAQYGGGSGGGTSTTTTGAAGSAGTILNKNYHVGFDRPEAWGLKYFASATLLNGLLPPEPSEGHRTGSISLGIETGWLPTLDAGQERIGFNGKAPEDLNQ